MTLYFTQDHEWIRVEGDSATVGISDHAQEALGDIVFAEVPEAGKQLSKGQEAAVVLVSMTTSTAEDISRGMDFLYSRNRLNVAISRAKSLAIVVASPKLLEASCNTIEQLKLVNTLCFVKAYAEG